MLAANTLPGGCACTHVDVVWNLRAVVSTHITLDETTNIALS